MGASRPDDFVLCHDSVLLGSFASNARNHGKMHKMLVGDKMKIIPIECEYCNGTGHECPGEVCGNCEGRGVVVGFEDEEEEEEET